MVLKFGIRNVLRSKDARPCVSTCNHGQPETRDLQLGTRNPQL